MFRSSRGNGNGEENENRIESGVGRLVETLLFVENHGCQLMVLFILFDIISYFSPSLYKSRV